MTKDEAWELVKKSKEISSDQERDRRAKELADIEERIAGWARRGWIYIERAVPDVSLSTLEMLISRGFGVCLVRRVPDGATHWVISWGSYMDLVRLVGASGYFES